MSASLTIYPNSFKSVYSNQNLSYHTHAPIKVCIITPVFIDRSRIKAGCWLYCSLLGVCQDQDCLALCSEWIIVVWSPATKNWCYMILLFLMHSSNILWSQQWVCLCRLYVFNLSSLDVVAACCT